MLHLRAVGRPAVLSAARRGVHEQLHGPLNLRGAVASVLLGHARAAIAAVRAAAAKRVLVSHGVLALLAHVEIGARLAAPALSGLELALAHVAGRHERGLRGVVQVVQHHHRGVLRAP